MKTSTSSYTHRLENGELVYCSEAVEMLHYDKWPTGFGLCPHDPTGETIVEVD